MSDGSVVVFYLGCPVTITDRRGRIEAHDKEGNVVYRGDSFAAARKAIRDHRRWPSSALGSLMAAQAAQALSPRPCSRAADPSDRRDTLEP